MNAPAKSKIIDAAYLFNTNYNQLMPPATDESTQTDEDIDDENDEIDETVNARPGLKSYHGSKGYVQVGRKVCEGAIFQNYDYQRFFWLMDLYFMANYGDHSLYAPGTSIPVPIKHGQVMTSWNQLKKRWKLKSDKKIRKFLERAAQDGQIIQEYVLADGTRFNPNSDSGRSQRVLCTVITLCHYIHYQNKGDSDGGKAA